MDELNGPLIKKIINNSTLHQTIIKLNQIYSNHNKRTRMIKQQFSREPFSTGCCRDANENPKAFLSLVQGFCTQKVNTHRFHLPSK